MTRFSLLCDSDVARNTPLAATLQLSRIEIYRRQRPGVSHQLLTLPAPASGRPLLQRAMTSLLRVGRYKINKKLE